MENYSVLMSVYYKEKADYLRESIQSMLEQTVPPDDFVLVCDGPLNEELDEVIADYERRFPCVFQIVRLDTNMGLGNALNIGIRYCKNELIARMDSDDISLPGRCESQLTQFEEDPSLDIMSGTLLEFDQDVSHITVAKYLPETNTNIHVYARKRCPFNHPAVMYKKSAVIKAGGYVDFPLFEDYHLWIRMLHQGAKAFNIHEPILLMRAGRSMYQRRGGLNYIKKLYRFRRYMLKIGFCSVSDYIISVSVQIFFSLLPIRQREMFYSKFLRNQYNRSKSRLDVTYQKGNRK